MTATNNDDTSQQVSSSASSAAAATFGQRLRQARERAGLSQVALAGEDLHPSYVSLLEAGRRTPTPAVMKLLAARVGVRAEELAGDVVDDLTDKIVLGEAALATGKPADAVALLAPVAVTLHEQRLAADAVAFRGCQVYATALERVGRMDDATAVGERLRAAAESAPGRLPWLPVVVALVRCYREAGDLGRAVDLGEDALRRYRDLRLEAMDGHAALVSTLAGVYSERGDYLRAKTMLDDLIEHTGRAGSRTDQAYAYWNAAINAAERGHVGEGLRLAERASALVSEADDRSTAMLHLTRAWLLLAERPPDPAKARRLLRAALPGLRQHAGQTSVASAETELARCELLLGRPDVAIRLARAALKRLPPDNRIERARALTALGAALVATDETAAGVAELEEAAETLAAHNCGRQSGAVWRQLSAVFRSLGDAARALHAADRAMDAAGLTEEAVVPEVDLRSASKMRPARQLSSPRRR